MCEATLCQVDFEGKGMHTYDLRSDKFTQYMLTDEWMGTCLSSPVCSTSCYSSVNNVKASEMG